MHVLVPLNLHNFLLKQILIEYFVPSYTLVWNLPKHSRCQGNHFLVICAFSIVSLSGSFFFFSFTLSMTQLEISCHTLVKIKHIAFLWVQSSLKRCRTWVSQMASSSYRFCVGMEKRGRNQKQKYTTFSSRLYSAFGSWKVYQVFDLISQLYMSAVKVWHKCFFNNFLTLVLCIYYIKEKVGKKT